jgi:salicylate hydroxylase
MALPTDRIEVAISGAGIAGLTAALCLARQGNLVHLFEKAQSFTEIGAGIQLSPNAMQILHLMDLREQIEAHAMEPEAIEIRVGSTGRLLTSIPLRDACLERYGAPYLVVHRADLMQVLVNAARLEPNINMTTGTEIGNVRSGVDNVTFSIAGDQFQAGLLLAADGVQSSIRQAITGQTAADLRKTAWRASLQAPRYEGMISAERTGLWLGKAAHLVHYPLRQGNILNLVLIGNADASAPHFLLAQFDNAVRKLAAEAEWKPWPLMHVDPGGNWFAGRVAFLGDAAHAMLPTAAQGGAMAIEDGFMLAHCLNSSPDGPETALARWQQIRKPRVSAVVRQAKFNLNIYGLGGPAASARNLAIAMIPGNRHLARLDWLYGWQPE